MGICSSHVQYLLDSFEGDAFATFGYRQSIAYFIEPKPRNNGTVRIRNALEES